MKDTNDGKGVKAMTDKTYKQKVREASKKWKEAQEKFGKFSSEDWHYHNEYYRIVNAEVERFQEVA